MRCWMPSILVLIDEDPCYDGPGRTRLASTIFTETHDSANHE